MRSEQITIRLDQSLVESLKVEAKKRNQTVAGLARSFILQGVHVPFDFVTRRILELQEELEKSHAVVAALTGANLHIEIEEWCLKIPKKSEESHDDYSARLKVLYRNRVKSMIEKGAKIVKVVNEGTL